MLEILYSKIMDDDNIDNKMFSLFIKFAEGNKPLHSDAISYLKSLNPNKITLVHAPLIEGFMGNLEKKDMIDDFISELNSNVQAKLKGGK